MEPIHLLSRSQRHAWGGMTHQNQPYVLEELVPVACLASNQSTALVEVVTSSVDPPAWLAEPAVPVSGQAELQMAEQPSPVLPNLARVQDKLDGAGHRTET